MLSVNEIFQSIQGEGAYAGTVATFIRFAGCNLQPPCSFCDTKYAQSGFSGKQMSVDDIVKEVAKFNSHLVVLTGGEPLAQPFDELKELVARFYEDQQIEVVAIETNGTIDFSDDAFDCSTWITVSPKREVLFRTRGDELKLLYDGTQNLEIYEKMSFDEYYLQPILPNSTSFFEDSKEVQAEALKAYSITIDALKLHPRWKLSAQLHKLIGIR